MTTSTASGSIEIDVPVGDVFALVSDLGRFMRVVPSIDRVVIRNVDTSEDGATFYTWTAGSAMGPFRGRMRGTSTREQVAANKRVVYRHAMGLRTVEEFDLEPTETGTRLLFTVSVRSPIPGLDR